jgi:ABC-type phosphate/phosphonate transport system substrate-binding protein
LSPHAHPASRVLQTCAASPSAGEPDTSFGNTVPRIVLAANGINPDKDLRAARFAGFADQVAVAVCRRECDAGVNVDVLTDPLPR